MLYRYQGMGSAQPSAAGEINGIQTLKADLRSVAAAVVDAFGPSAELDRADYERFLAQAKHEPDQLRDVNTRSARIHNFLLGTVADVASSVARAVQISRIPVSSESARAENHRLQAEFIGAARIMLDSASASLRGIEPRSRSREGLGAPQAVGLLVALAAAVYVVVGVSAVVMIGLCFESRQRMAHAREAADAYCARRAARPGGRECTAEEYAQIARTLQLGPLDDLGKSGAAALENLLTVAGIAVGVAGGALLLAGAAWFFFSTRAGRRTIEGARDVARSKGGER